MSAQPDTVRTPVPDRGSGREHGATIALRNHKSEYPGRDRARVLALRDVSFDIAPGEIVAIRGASGCGKTTLLKDIADVAQAKLTSGHDGGREGIRVQFADGERGPVCWVRQDYGPTLLPWYRAVDNVGIPLRLHGRPRRECHERAEAILRSLGISHQEALGAIPRDLSGGQQQRLAIARSMIAEPSLLLLDEPFANLDSRAIEAMQNELLELHRRVRPTVLLVSHNLGAALAIVDRVLLFAGSPGTCIDEVAVRRSEKKKRQLLEPGDYMPLMTDIVRTEETACKQENRMVVEPGSPDAEHEGRMMNVSPPPVVTSLAKLAASGRARIREWLAPITTSVLLVVLWWGISESRLVNPVFLPSPGSVLGSLGSMLSNQGIYEHLGTTLYRAGVGLAISVGVGVPLGLLLGQNTRLYDFVQLPVDFFRSIPSSALFFLFILVFGIGHSSKIAVVVYGCSLIMLIGAVDGAKATPDKQARLDMMSSFGASRLQKFCHVTLRDAIPHVATSFRTCVSLSLVLVIVTEMFLGGNRGLGRQLHDYYLAYQIPEMYSVLLMLGSIGFLVNKVSGWFERRVAFWSSPSDWRVTPELV